MTVSVAAPTASARLQWLALSLTPGLGATRGKRLAEFFGSIGRVFAASLTELESTGVPAVSAQAIATGKSLAGLVTLEDPEYPALLRQIYDPPLTLHVRGDAGLLCRPALAMVGTRHPTPYGCPQYNRGC